MALIRKSCARAPAFTALALKYYHFNFDSPYHTFISSPPILCPVCQLSPQILIMETPELIKCPFKGCRKSFKTEKELRQHKTKEVDHIYCTKCKLDFEDWEAFVQHKAGSSSKIHISCQFCGMDFGSLSGRERHIKQTHPVDQRVECTACHAMFSRASGLISHLERSQCSAVSHSTFKSFVRHKQNVGEIMPDATTPQVEYKGGYIKAIEETAEDEDEDEDGGISLLTLNDDEAADDGLMKPLVPKKVRDDNTTLPTLSQRSGNIFRPADFPTLSDARLISVPSKPGWNKKLDGKKEDTDKTSLLTYGALDPRSANYSVKRFRSSLSNDYECPFPTCTFEAKIGDVLTSHIATEHDLEQPFCPGCLKYFHSLAQLVAHAESTEKCKIAKSKKFKPWLNIITGGFLASETRMREDVEFKALMRARDGELKEKTFGMSYTKFKGAVPDEMERVQTQDEVDTRKIRFTQR